MSGILTCKQGIFLEHVCHYNSYMCLSLWLGRWLPKLVGSLHVTELLDMGRCGFVCPPQCFFQREAWALVEQFLLEVKISTAGDNQFQQVIV